MFVLISIALPVLVQLFAARINMKYWTIAFPGERGQNVVETWSEKQILDSYFPYWCEMMVKSGKGDFVNEADCIDDWCVVHWAVETDEWGNRLEKTIQELLDKEAKLGNERYDIHKRIVEMRGTEAPICWGHDDCSTSILMRCPWRIDCGDNK